MADTTDPATGSAPREVPTGGPPAAAGAPAAALLWAALLGVGICWGSTQFFMKGAMQGGFHPIGAAFWQAAVGAVVASAALWLAREPLPLSRWHLVFYAVCGLLGTALPASLSFEAIQHLPVGVQSLVISTVPIITVVLALGMGLERASRRRLAGIGLGFAAMLLIILPDASLPGAGQAFWVLLPALSAAAYAMENVVIDRYRPPGTGALAIGCGLLWAATAMLAPPVLVLGISVLPASAAPGPMVDMAAVVTANIMAYLGFVWLVGHAGPIFASQVGYVVTGTGVLSGLVFLGERHAVTVWLAMALMVVGLALVSPRRHRPGTAPTPTPNGPAKTGPAKTSTAGPAPGSTSPAAAIPAPATPAQVTPASGPAPGSSPPDRAR
ncbi:MAG: DMT family transporter [Pseudomonadota bacterium]